MATSARVRKWLDKKDGRAESTRQTQQRQLERFLRKTGLTEDTLLSAARSREKIERVADAFVDAEKTAGRRPAYALAVWYGVKSFLDNAGVPVAYNPALTPAEMEPADFESRRVPTPEELRRLIDSVSLRNRSICLFLASSAVRVGVLGTGAGADRPSDGLRLENLPDLDIETGLFKKKPPLVFVPPRLSKNGKPYMTAISTEAATVLEGYLAQRIRSGEELGRKSPVFIPDPRGTDRKARTIEGYRTLNRNGLSNSVSEWFAAVAPPGVHWTAHTLRAWASSRLESAESQGLISRTRREFFLGHSLGVDGTYNLNRPLSPEAQEDIRATYQKVESFLSTAPVSHGGRDIGTLKLLLEILGVPEGKVSEEELRDATPEELKALARKYLGQGAAPAQRVVSNGEIPTLLSQGWTFVATLEGSQAILRPPE
ncbi:MAG: hypothetical protein ACLQD9_06705 [Thermoplasmata archaeon]